MLNPMRYKNEGMCRRGKGDTCVNGLSRRSLGVKLLASSPGYLEAKTTKGTWGLKRLEFRLSQGHLRVGMTEAHRSQLL